jgi:hypothetical protein
VYSDSFFVVILKNSFEVQYKVLVSILNIYMMWQFTGNIFPTEIENRLQAFLRGRIISESGKECGILVNRNQGKLHRKL